MLSLNKLNIVYVCVCIHNVLNCPIVLEKQFLHRIVERCKALSKLQGKTEADTLEKNERKKITEC